MNNNDIYIKLILSLNLTTQHFDLKNSLIQKLEGNIW